MIGLAVALALADKGFGHYGENVFWNVSPVNAVGAVATNEGIWVSALPLSVTGDVLTTQVTVSTRFYDPIEQAKTLTRLMDWMMDEAPKLCSLSTAPVIDASIEIIDCHALTGSEFEAVDAEGRWVISVAMQVRHKRPALE